MAPRNSRSGREYRPENIRSHKRTPAHQAFGIIGFFHCRANSSITGLPETFPAHFELFIRGSLWVTADS